MAGRSRSRPASAENGSVSAKQRDAHAPGRQSPQQAVKIVVAATNRHVWIGNWVRFAENARGETRASGRRKFGAGEIGFVSQKARSCAGAGDPTLYRLRLESD
jgi:hypothetical protein